MSPPAIRETSYSPDFDGKGLRNRTASRPLVANGTKSSKARYDESHPSKSIVAADTERVDATEFGGPWGCFGIMAFSHCLMYYFWYCLEFNKGGVSGPASIFSVVDWRGFVSDVINKASIYAYPTSYAWKIYVSYVFLEVLLAFVMPGLWIKGLPVPSERNVRHSYLCNALWSWYAFLLVGVGLHRTGVWRVTELAENYGPVMTVSVIVGNAMSLAIYLAARLQHKENRMTGNFVYDLFMGVYLNPRIAYFDFKIWAEIRISWKLLFFLTVSAAVKQYEMHGVVTWPMIFMVVAHFLYTNACQKGEECIPTTWDIFYENWGWMIIFWNFAGVPFVYTFQSYFILKQDPYNFHPVVHVFHFIMLFGAYYIWDTANSQKNKYRMQREGTYVKRRAFPQLPWGVIENPRTIEAKCGSSLLVDGWWAKARKIHYTADICMALSWGLACGASYLPYFYVCFFSSFLMHRVYRDLERCSKKYGDDWVSYCQQVPYIFIPGVF